MSLHPRVLAGAADVEVKLATTEAERRDARDVLWATCREENWTEAADFLDQYVVPLRTRVWYVADGGRTAAALVLAENEWPVFGEHAWPGLSIDAGKWAEIALLGVTRRARVSGLDLALIRAMARYARSVDITHYLAILDERRHAYFRSLGILFREVPESRGGGRKVFWGETCFPAVLPRGKGEVELHEKNPSYWGFVFEP